MNVVGPAPRPSLEGLDGLWFQFGASVHVRAERKHEPLFAGLDLIEVHPTVAVYILCHVDSSVNDTMNTLYSTLHCAIFLLICQSPSFCHCFQELFFQPPPQPCIFPTVN